MDARLWQSLFDTLRPQDQSAVVISLRSGFSISIQSVARVEEGLVMVRGRVAGQAESGRLFLCPYDQIETVFVNKVVRIEEAELYSPSVSPQRKEEVARMVAALEERARQATLEAEKERQGGGSVGIDVRRQLEELREQAGLPAIPTQAPAGGPTQPGSPPTVAVPGSAQAPLTVPTNPMPKIGGLPSFPSLPGNRPNPPTALPENRKPLPTLPKRN